MKERPLLLAFAYACEPGGGSEPGAGWAVVQALAERADVIALVGPHFGDGITRWQNGGGDPRIRLVTVAESRWAPRPRGTVSWFLGYLAWQSPALQRAHELLQTHEFDAAVHVTYAAYWLPTPAARLDLPILSGPLGGAVTTPLSLWPALGPKGAVREIIELAAVRVCAALPATRASVRRADALVSQNEETTKALRRMSNRPLLERNHAEYLRPRAPRRRPAPWQVLWVSPLESRKGPRLAVRALAAADPRVRLTMIGDGPERMAVIRLAARLGVTARLRLTGRIPHEHVFDHIARASCFLFTGLREEGGIALAECLAAGGPAVILGNGGPRDLAARSRDPARIAVVRPAGLHRTAHALGVAMSRFSGAPLLDGFDGLLDWQGAVDELWSAVQHVVGESTHVSRGARPRRCGNPRTDEP